MDSIKIMILIDQLYYNCKNHERNRVKLHLSKLIKKITEERKKGNLSIKLDKQLRYSVDLLSFND